MMTSGRAQIAKVVSQTNCWICGDPATTREHIFKKSDLRANIRKPSSTKPIYGHNQKFRNIKIQSFDSKWLKPKKNLCEQCNSARTQSHDKAWEQLSHHLNRRLTIFPNTRKFFPKNVFLSRTALELINVHLYFVKFFGCMASPEIPSFDNRKLADAILRNRCSREIYLRFGRVSTGKVKAGITDLETKNAEFHDRTKCVRASIIYYIGEIAVHIEYIDVQNGERRIPGAWHPEDIGNSIKLENWNVRR